MKTNLLFLGLAAAALAINSCNSGGRNSQTGVANSAEPSTSFQNFASTGPNDDFYFLHMGSGYNSISNRAPSGQSCLQAAENQNNIYIANPAALITLDEVQNLNALENNFNIDVEGKFGADRFSNSIAANFTNASKDNDYSINVIYLYKYAGLASFITGTLKESDAALRPVAAEIVHTDQQRFYHMCGDSFIEQMDAGAVLALRLTLAFNSHSDQEKFKAKFNAEVGIASIASSIEQAANNSNVHVNFSLSALQIGGEPHKLNDVFGDKNNNGSYPFLDCSSIGSKDEKACIATIGSIISYAQTIKNQLATADGKLKLHNLYYSNPVFTPYANLGIKIGSINPTREALQAMQELTEGYDKTLANYTFVNHYLTALQAYLDNPTKTYLADSLERLRKQLKLVYLSDSYKLLNCYKYTVSDECLSIKQNIDSDLKRFELLPVETNLLNYLETTSYVAALYTYDNSGITDPDSYHKAHDCVIAPISSPINADYALSCNGNWLATPKGLRLINNGLKGTLFVSGLSYHSGLDKDKPVTISYPDVNLDEDAYYPNSYYAGKLKMQAESAFDAEPAFTIKTDLTITKLFHNQA